MWRFLRNIVDAIVDAVEEIVEAVVSWAANLFMTVLAIAVNLLQAAFALITLDFDRAGRELVEAFRSLWELVLSVTLGFVGLVIQLVLVLVSFVQRIIGFEDPARNLNDNEIAYLTPIFGSSINYRRINIVDGNIGIFNNGGGVTIGNTVRVSSSSNYSPVTDPANHGFLVHEVVHIWHYQNGGPRYISQALLAQFFSATSGGWVDYPLATIPATSADIRNAPAGYAFASSLDADEQWDGLNPEQQATLVDAAFALGMDFNVPDTFNFVFPPDATGQDYSEQLRFAAGLIRAGRGVPVWPPSTLGLEP
jgi:hypothetical protein